MSSHLLGVVSDTHGLLRPEAVAALHGVEMILHAGDIGKPEILESLRAIAPVTAIRGNNDKDGWANSLSDWEVVDVDGVSIYMLHNLRELDLVPEAAGFNVVIAGHSHKPLIEERRGVMYLNPGSIGPRRFTLPVTLAHLRIEKGTPTAEIIELTV
jgi:putative phosphoesterase